jgi:hypothetical protein
MWAAVSLLACVGPHRRHRGAPLSAAHSGISSSIPPPLTALPCRRWWNFPRAATTCRCVDLARVASAAKPAPHHARAYARTRTREKRRMVPQPPMQRPPRGPCGAGRTAARRGPRGRDPTNPRPPALLCAWWAARACVRALECAWVRMRGCARVRARAWAASRVREQAALLSRMFLAAHASNYHSQPLSFPPPLPPGGAALAHVPLGHPGPRPQVPAALPPPLTSRRPPHTRGRACTHRVAAGLASLAAHARARRLWWSIWGSSMACMALCWQARQPPGSQACWPSLAGPRAWLALRWPVCALSRLRGERARLRAWAGSVLARMGAHAHVYAGRRLPLPRPRTCGYTPGA